MAKVDIVETTLQDGTTGKCAYVDGATFTDFKMTIQKHLIEGNKYTISFLYKTNVRELNHIELLSGGYDVYELRRTGTIRIGEWEKCHITFTSDGNYPVLYFPNCEYWMYALMVEEGTVASTWSASVNDTRVDTESIIEQKSESITIKVEGAVLEKVGEDFVQKNNVIAEINAQVDPEKGTSEVQINAGAINFNGLVTANENFMVFEDGSTSTTSGLFKESLAILGDLIPGTMFDQHYRSSIRLGRYQGNDIDSYYYNSSAKEMEHYEGGILSSQPYLAIIDNLTDKTYSNLRANYIYTNGIELDGDLLIGGEVHANDIDCKGLHAKSGWFESVKTKGGADLDSNVKSHTEVSARGTSSAVPTVDISAIPSGSDIRIEVGVPLDNASTPTVAWFSLKTKKPSGTSDYLFNAGGYYYSNNYYGSVFIRVSASRVTIDGSWSRAYYNGTTLNFKSSSSQIYVYTEHL